jgi:hypothetical protein
MSLVFLSHSSTDKPTARKIRDELEDKGVRVWLDEVEIRVGHSIATKIENGLNSADVLCLLISKGALASKWVMREYQAFLHKSMKDDRPIIPCRLDTSEMPTLISDIKYADFSGGFESGMSALLGAVVIEEEIAQRRVVAVSKRIIETVLAAHSSEPRKHLLELMMSGIENQKVTEEQNTLLEELATACDKADEFDLEGAVFIGDFDVWYVTEEIEIALKELRQACSA